MTIIIIILFVSKTKAVVFHFFLVPVQNTVGCIYSRFSLVAFFLLPTPLQSLPCLCC